MFVLGPVAVTCVFLITSMVHTMCQSIGLLKFCADSSGKSGLVIRAGQFPHAMPDERFLLSCTRIGTHTSSPTTQSPLLLSAISFFVMTSTIGQLLKQNKHCKKMIAERKSGKVQNDELSTKTEHKSKFTKVLQAYPLGYIWSMLFWKYVTYWLLVRRPGLAVAAELLGPRMLFHIGTVAEFVVYIYCVGLDPGYLPLNLPSDVESSACEVDKNDPSFCAYCNRIQPERSKHCFECDRCVQKFDHHCPILYSCVGLQNHAAFVCLCAGITAWAFAYTGYCHEILFGFDSEQESLFPVMRFNWGAIFSFRQHPLLVALYLHSWLHIMWMTPLVLIHMIFMCVNVTTYEILKRRVSSNGIQSDPSGATCRCLNGRTFGLPFMFSGNPFFNVVRELVLSFAPRRSSIYQRTVQKYLDSVEHEK